MIVNPVMFVMTIILVMAVIRGFKSPQGIISVLPASLVILIF